MLPFRFYTPKTHFFTQLPGIHQEPNSFSMGHSSPLVAGGRASSPALVNSLCRHSGGTNSPNILTAKRFARQPSGIADRMSSCPPLLYKPRRKHLNTSSGGGTRTTRENTGKERQFSGRRRRIRRKRRRIATHCRRSAGPIHSRGMPPAGRSAFIASISLCDCETIIAGTEIR